MKRLYFCIVFFVSALCVYAQSTDNVMGSNSRSAKPFTEKKGTGKNPHNPTPQPTPQPSPTNPPIGRVQNQTPTTPKGLSKDSIPTTIEKSDSTGITTLISNNKEYAYYANIVKKFGWYEGVGKKLSLDEAQHLPCYYKLSRKYAGHWTFLEAFDGYGNPTTNHNINTYVVNLGDNTNSVVNPNWEETLEAVCQWELVPDITGKEVIQERFLNEDGKFCFAFNPLEIGEREYIGSYTDESGREICLKTNDDGSIGIFANFVQITLNKDGFEECIRYTDRNGYPQKKSGIFGVRREYDKQGRLIKELYINANGDRMTDYLGQSGWEIIFRKSHRDKYFLDVNNQRTKEYSRGLHEVYGYRYYFDQYGRDTLRVALDKDGEPYAEEGYCSRERTTYNTRGQVTYNGKHNNQGTLCGYTHIEQSYDNYGHLTRWVMKDSEGRYQDNYQGICVQEAKYDSKGEKLLNLAKFSVNKEDSSLFKFYEYKVDKKGNITRIWYDKSYQRIDSVDNKNRTTSIRYLDLSGIPINNPEGDSLSQWSYKRIQYDDKTNTTITEWFDKNDHAYSQGESIDDLYSKSVITKDDKKSLTSSWHYQGNLLTEAYQLVTGANSNKVSSQWGITYDGKQARTGWQDAIYYREHIDYTMYGRIRTVTCRNEFNEPSYIIDFEDENVYYFRDRNNGNTRYYDEYGKQIADSLMSEFKDTLPRAFCIEVTDTAIAYPLGLRNGDIIISYGDWTIAEDLLANTDYFYLETILKAMEQKQITILRHNPKKKTSTIIHIDNLPIGKTSDLGFYPHLIYYTQKEKLRLLQTCTNYDITLASTEIPEYEQSVMMAVQRKGGFNETKLFHYPQYGIKDPGIILYAKEKWKDRIDTWSAADDIDAWNELDGLFYIDSTNLYITQDLDSCAYIFKRGEGYFGMRIFELPVAPTVKDKIYSLLTQKAETIGGEELAKKVNKLLGSISRNEVIGKWTTTGSYNDNSDYILEADFEQNNQASFKITINYTVEKDFDVTMNFSVTMDMTGLTWNIQDRTLVFDTINMRSTHRVNHLKYKGENKGAVRKYNKDKKFYKDLYSSIFDDYNIFRDFFKSEYELNIKNVSTDEIYLKERSKPLIRVKKRK